MSLPDDDQQQQQQPEWRAVGFILAAGGSAGSARRGELPRELPRSLLSELLASAEGDWEQHGGEDEEDAMLHSSSSRSHEPKLGTPVHLQRTYSMGSACSSSTSSLSLPIDIPDGSYLKGELRRKQLRHYLAQRRWNKQQELHEQQRADEEARQAELLHRFALQQVG
jgi:hypothetical protein